MTQSGYLLLGLTAIVGVLAAVLAFAVLKIGAAARRSAREARAAGAETAFMAAAMEEALGKLRLEERAMHARAEASERLNSEIVASLTSGLLLVDQNGRVRMLNPAGRRLLGLPDANWEGPLRDVLAGAVPLADAVVECLSTGTPIVRRTLTLGEGAAAPHLGVTVSPIGDQGGSHSHGAICLFTDLSKIVDLEEQLRLKDSLARVGELTAGIAHEFRNGLATIHGYARLLDLERLPTDFRPYVSGIREETEALSQVVTNFLNFARPTELTMSAVAMADVIERAVDDVRAEVGARGGEIIVRGEFADVMGDEVLLRQAFSNLCRNALEACLDADVVPRIVVDSLVDRRASVIRISVSDNGPGVPAELADRVFRPFFTTKARGTGLGLALVLKIIVTHNGRVGLDPSHQGAQVIVTLPIHQR